MERGPGGLRSRDGAGGGEPCAGAPTPCASSCPAVSWRDRADPVCLPEGRLGPLSRQLFGRDSGRHVPPGRDDGAAGRVADSPAASRGRLLASWAGQESWEGSSSCSRGWTQLQVWVSTPESIAEAQKGVGQDRDPVGFSSGHNGVRRLAQAHCLLEGPPRHWQLGGPEALPPQVTAPSRLTPAAHLLSLGSGSSALPPA